MSERPLPADLVLEGGGVKGIALAGAVSELARGGYRFHRVCGTSAGAVVGAVLAAMEGAGEPLGRLEEIARSLPYERVRDRGPVARIFARAGLAAVVDGMAVAVEGGVYEGDYLTRWLRGVLADLGVRTFADLRLPPDPDDDLPPAHRYALVVIASDVSRRRLVRLPWDCGDYGLAGDELDVAEAVRASAAVPFLFRPVRLAGGPGNGTVTLVDGGLVSHFPIAIFDRTDGRAPRWPTFGIRPAALRRVTAPDRPVSGPLALARAAIETMLTADDAQRMSLPCDTARTVVVDTGRVPPFRFDLDRARQDALVGMGADAVRAFLRSWDFDRWRASCRGGGAR